ncbi:hypothetical protein [Methanobrevibacter sp.]|uniref:hypothetical protein n=1 Tax=Methanobrevibacter sp. TaxID=66852 RepID=UPI00388F9761
MIYKGCNGTVMLSSESEVVRVNPAYCELEKFLISFSKKYGSGENYFFLIHQKIMSSHQYCFSKKPLK